MGLAQLVALVVVAIMFIPLGRAHDADIFWRRFGRAVIPSAGGATSL